MQTHRKPTARRARRLRELRPWRHAAQLAAPSQSTPSHPSQPQTGCQHHAALSHGSVTTPEAARRRASHSKGERRAEASRKFGLRFSLITHANYHAH